jgi:hypothetical protein
LDGGSLGCPYRLGHATGDRAWRVIEVEHPEVPVRVSFRVTFQE